MTGSTSHKANGTITSLELQQNKIGDVGAVALADALKATFAMCFSMCARHVLLAILGAVSLLQTSLNFGTHEVKLDRERSGRLVVCASRSVRCEVRSGENAHSSVFHGRCACHLLV